MGIDRTTELHMELLAFGPMAQFGDRVIRDTIYVSALQDKLLEVAIAEIDGRPAGFIAYSLKPHDFHSLLIRNHLLKAVWVMALALITNPTRLRHIPRALKVIFSRDELPGSAKNIKTEVVCFGVRPEYLTPAFVKETGLRVGVRLLDHAFAYFRQHGFDRTRMIVDADNTRALLFYQSLGADLTACMFGGIPSYIVEIDLDAL
ncbi:MAG: GNAT family N-acetyltransferase [Anaerolineae bacterium]|nr:GNAT family N-acetyltransferase [Anaerolineae bacterium]